MEKELFVRENDLDKINEIQKQYEYSDSNISDFDFELDDKYEVKIINGDKEYKGTQQFYVSLFKLMNIPFPFSQKIPSDLLLTNLKRLKSEFDTKCKIVNRGNTLVNAVNMLKNDGKDIHFENLNTSELLEYFNSDNYKIENCYIGDKGAVVDILHNDLGEFDLEQTEVGEIVKVGYRIQNPFTFLANRTRTSLFVEQLSCKNGMVMPSNFLNSSISLNKQLSDSALYIEKLKNDIDHAIGKRYNLDEISDLFKKLSKTKIKYRWLKPVFSKIRSLNDDIFSAIFGIADEGQERNDDIEWFKTKFREKENENYELTYFDIIFKLTEMCQKLDYGTRLLSEDYVSSIINTYIEQEEKIKEFKLSFEENQLN